MTGLEIVANQPDLPELILVETNVLGRSTDGAVVERYSRGDIEQLFFRPVRAAVAARQRRHAPTHEQVALNLRKLVEQPPGEFDSRAMWIARLSSLMRRIQQMPRGSTKGIEELIRRLEQRGRGCCCSSSTLCWSRLKVRGLLTTTRGDHSRPVSRSASMAADRC
ncbi:hypothetical protein ACFIOY_16695 [Bradyrhizobium sp. TZ2]